ncbi:MAG: Holliday junction branch migration protein RuvA [Legionellaceae bacterium]|nr:Holliday junction branch migration protein RuvA [Legionellaceae bacterium]
MIGRLSGKLIEKQPPQLLVDVNGVGYVLSASMNTCYKLPEINQDVVLFTQMIVREDAQLLYGFFDKHERDLFNSLIKVNGVGPKMALAILSSMDPDGFVACVDNNDSTSLTSIPGVGKKTAERLVVEMRDRLKAWQPVTMSVTSHASGADQVKQAFHDAIAALIALGYKPQEASKMISRVANDEMSSQELIKASLQQSVKETLC